MKKQISSSQIDKEIGKLYAQLKAFREDLHRHPELSWKEFRTTEKIESLLSGNGIDAFQRPLDTGGFVDLVFKKGAPFLLFRADIDALPIQDKKKKPYSSKNAGVCHSCGHDMHTTIIAGLALAIHKLNPDLPFNLRFVFQPAEEVIPNGASKMLKAGVLKNVKHAFGLHVEPRLDFGVISLTPGWVNMQCTQVDINLSGEGGHSAYPHKCADLVWIASRIIQESYQIIYREVDILKSPTILSFTGIQAGEGHNILPSKLKISGTFRNASPEVKEHFFKKLSGLTNSITKETGAKIEIKCIEGAPPVSNDPDLIQKLQDNAQSFEGFNGIVADMKTPGGDDFGSYSQKVPSALIRFGFGKKGFTSLLHTDTFDVPPELIKTAVSFFAHQILHFE